MFLRSSAYGLGFWGLFVCTACGGGKHADAPAADGGEKAPLSSGSSGTSGRAAAGSGGSKAGSSGAGSGADTGHAGRAGGAGSGGAGSGGAAAVSGSHWQPKPGLSWQYQLQGSLDTGVDADVFDIDLFNTSADAIGKLQAQQRKVVCYFDTAYESYRDDSKQLEPYKGNPIDGWPGQYWVDVRQQAVVDVMLKRIEVAVSKGCDAVEADDVDARSNQPGFPITAQDQQGFIIKLADAAHALGLGFGLKNDLDEVKELVSHADFAINEQCFEYDECDSLTPFISAGKPVFNVEYTDGDLASKAGQICDQAKTLGFASIIKHLDLDAPRYGCP
jgi:hypothetical protein